MCKMVNCDFTSRVESIQCLKSFKESDSFMDDCENDLKQELRNIRIYRNLIKIENK